jgi:HEAT repeat protein
MHLATSDVAEFRQFFRRLRKLFPALAAEASLLYLSSRGVDSAASSMAFWFGGDSSYIAVLPDEKSFSAEAAAKAVSVVKDIDPHFMLKFSEATTRLDVSSTILRALALVPAIGDYSALIPWLHEPAQHSDIRVRSRAAKLHCELRPNKRLIEHRMQSDDARVRAGAIEALAEYAGDLKDARSMFHAALEDKHHRVVGNALVGLYSMGETEVMYDMVALSNHEDYLFLAATAWAMGFVKDLRAIPALPQLTSDSSLVVRKRALHNRRLTRGICRSLGGNGQNGINAGGSINGS